MNKVRLFFAIKIFFSLSLALIITLTLFRTLFFFNTPKFNPLFLAKMKKDFLALFSKKNSYGRLAATPLSAMTPIAKGVYAKEDKQLKTVYIRITKEARREEKIIQVNGGKILLRFVK